MSQKRNAKASKNKADEPYEPPDQTLEDALDHLISDIEQNLEHTSQNKKQKRGQQKKSTNATASEPLNIKEFQLNEAEEDKSTKRLKTQANADVSGQAIVKVTEAPKIWTAAECALLKAIIVGLSPTGRNIAGIIFLFLLFCFYLHFLLSLFPLFFFFLPV